MDFRRRITGLKISPGSGRANAREPRSTPAENASRNPRLMRANECKMAAQKSGSVICADREPNTSAGPTSRMELSTAMLAPCQTQSQNRTMRPRRRNRRFPVLFIAFISLFVHIVEIVGRHGASHGGGILVEEHA